MFHKVLCFDPPTFVIVKENGCGSKQPQANIHLTYAILNV